ncbi:MAG: hypothetical protein EOP45_22945 [Sphingobacteriaceae bacterium]|nr:MAG: hypothetical protein EOP45_22945 [Sphingobacteriaceae bacterium]
MSNTIAYTAKAIYHAGAQVVFTNGFYAQNGSQLRGYVEGCSSTFSGRPAYTDEEITANDIVAAAIDKFTIVPNPTNGILLLQMEQNILGRVDIVNMLGQRILTQSIIGQEINIDISNQARKTIR